jgi:hypothetical protein
MKIQLTQKEIIDAVSACSAAIKANSGISLGDEDVIMLANKKLIELIPMIKTGKSVLPSKVEIKGPPSIYT